MPNKPLRKLTEKGIFVGTPPGCLRDTRRCRGLQKRYSVGENQKGTAERGREKKTSRQFVTNVTTIYDILRPDVPVSQTTPGVARPGEGRFRVVGNATIPPIPWAAGVSEDMQPMALLRAVFGMHDQALESRVIAVLREHIETRPKNVSFSEDNGYSIPTGARLDFGIYPQDSAVHVDRRHWRSTKWSWGL